MQELQTLFFPLHTVLYPGGPLPLRIFETRYLDMVSRCLKTDSPFGVLLIREGSEAGRATTHDIGTLARITDWNQGSDGVLGVTVVGEKRFRVLSRTRQPDGLSVGEIELIDDESSVPLPLEFEKIAIVLGTILADLGLLYDSLDKHFDDASWVGYRFAEILPIDRFLKQRCLEMNDPLARLKIVSDALKKTVTKAERSA